MKIHHPKFRGENISEDTESIQDVEDRVISNTKKRPLWARKMLEENNIELDEISKEGKKT